MSDDQHRYSEQIEALGQRIAQLDIDVRLLRVADGHPTPGLRIVLDDELAEFVCVYTPFVDVDGLEDLDLLNLVLSRGEVVDNEHRDEVDIVLPVINEMCPLGHFGVRHEDDTLYFRAELVTAHGVLPDIAAFADALKLVSYADISLRPHLVHATMGTPAHKIVDDLLSA